MSSSEEEEEFLVHVEFDGVLEKDVLDRSPVFFKMIGVEGKRPVMQIGNQTFAGEYHDIVGTALFFEEDPSPAGSDPVFTTIPQHQLRYVCKTRKALLMSRVFLKRKDSVQDDCGLDLDVETGENSTNKNQETGANNVHVSSLDDLTMEVQESPPLHSTQEKEESSRRSESEPVAGPSWMPDVLDNDVRDLQTLLEATASKNVTREVSRLVEKQIRITSDSTVNSVTDSDNVSDG